jgi:hypothetical protein
MYVLKRIEDGKYVCFGGEHSYTKQLEKAFVFPSRERAEAGACGNEVAVSVAEIVGFRG